jgi:hypothetical protein
MQPISSDAQTQSRAVRVSSLSMPGLILRLEGLAVFAGSVALYVDQGWSWLVFAVLLFAPDLAMLGYTRDTRTGARIYNVFHFYAPPLALLIGAHLAGNAAGMQIAVVWLAHIGLDRVFGYGLKYATAFKDTHLQRV